MLDKHRHRRVDADLIPTLVDIGAQCRALLHHIEAMSVSAPVSGDQLDHMIELSHGMDRAVSLYHQVAEDQS